jgi:hypothetical protein
MYRRYAVLHWFIHTLRVRIGAWGFRYFRSYPLRESKPLRGFDFAEFCGAKLLEAVLCFAVLILPPPHGTNIKPSL